MALAALMVLIVPTRSDESLIRSEVTRQIVKNSPWSGEDVEVDDITLTGLDVTKIKFDSVSVKVSKRMTNIGKVTVLATLFSGKKEVRNIWVSARIRVFKEVVVAFNSIRMNDKITKDDVKLMRMEMRDVADTLASVDEAVGMLARRPISEGTVIKSDRIKPQVIVKREERIVASVEKDKFAVESIGTAVQDGSRTAVDDQHP